MTKNNRNNKTLKKKNLSGGLNDFDLDDIAPEDLINLGMIFFLFYGITKIISKILYYNDQLNFLSKKEYNKYKILLDELMPKSLEIIEHLSERELTDKEVKKIYVVNTELKKLVKILNERLIDKSTKKYIFKSNKVKDTEKLIDYIVDIEKKQQKIDKVLTQITGRYRFFFKTARSAKRSYNELAKKSQFKLP